MKTKLLTLALLFSAIPALAQKRPSPCHVEVICHHINDGCKDQESRLVCDHHASVADFLQTQQQLESQEAQTSPQDN